MKTTVTFTSFCDAFRTMDREENFSYEGKRALFDYLEAYEEDTGEEIELDVVALCCDYNEMETADIVREYRIDIEDGDDVDEQVEEYLNDHTMLVAKLNNGCFLFANF